MASAMKKRWSGVQLNSKLSKAFEQLGEELESEYSDSLDGPKKSSSVSSEIRLLNPSIFSNIVLDVKKVNCILEQRKNVQ